MNRKNRGRKGATIAELLVVLAVLVIASTMVVSFSSMMHGAQGVSNARLEALQDVHLAESLIEGFIENNADKNLVVESNKIYYKETIDGEEKEYSAHFANGGALVITSVSSETPVMFLESITSITFDTARYGVIDNSLFTSNSHIIVDGINTDPDLSTRDTLYYCTINYSVDKTPYTYTFCVNPYVGEEVN